MFRVSLSIFGRRIFSIDRWRSDAVKKYRIDNRVKPLLPRRRELFVLSAALCWRSAVAGSFMAWRVDRASATDEQERLPSATKSVQQDGQRALQFPIRSECKPFLPSNATTDTGEFIDPTSFPTAKYCGHCHQEAYAQWRQSAHANSFRAPWYIKNVNLLMNGKGIEFARHCEGCHNPIALTSGAMTENSPVNRKFDDDGITCSVCHAIQKVNTRGHRELCAGSAGSDGG